MNNVTVAQNTAGAGAAGGISNPSGTVNVRNTIVAANSSAAGVPSDCAGILTSQGYNLVQTITGCTVLGDLTGNITGTSAYLAPLSEDIPPVHPLFPSSPAIEAGNPAAPGSGGNACEATDQRGVVRPEGLACDMGAYEREGGRGVMNYQVSAVRGYDNQAGELWTVLAWTADVDGNFATNEDRRIVIAQRNLSDWSITAPPELPAGADSPSVALGSAPYWNPFARLAFLVRGTGDDGVTSVGLGNQAALWSALVDWPGVVWEAAPVLDETGQPVHAEEPLVKGRTTLFRRFGGSGTNGYLGQLALTRWSGAGLPSMPPIYLTDDARMHWQPALAGGGYWQQVVVLNVARVISGSAAMAPASTDAHLAHQTTVLVGGSDPVESLVVEPGADPALTGALELSEFHAAPGSTVGVTATVRNGGLDAAAGVAVNFYDGTPVTGTLLATVDVGSLNFNASQAATCPVTASGGMQMISAEVTANGDINLTNNLAHADLGELPPPPYVNATVSQLYSDTLVITWVPPAVSGVEGYRILRSETPGGPYELVGEASGSSYYDTLLARDQDYYYVVQTYDAHGVRSVYSMEVTAKLSPYYVYLPLTAKQ
jgi:hypothetical protein